MALSKIISGGQTGVDRAALDAALAVGFPCGGWVPADGMAEDGVIDEKYPMMRLPQGGNRARTRINVVDSSGTAIIYFEALKGGTRLTRNLCALEDQPYLLIDARQVVDPIQAAKMLVNFVAEHRIEVLNVAGPRASGWKDGYRFAFDVIALLLASGKESGHMAPNVAGRLP
jgi:hypothetical protein